MQAFHVLFTSIGVYVCECVHACVCACVCGVSTTLSDGSARGHGGNCPCSFQGLMASEMPQEVYCGDSGIDFPDPLEKAE